MIARCFNVLLFDFVTMGITIENFIKKFSALHLWRYVSLLSRRYAVIN